MKNVINSVFLIFCFLSAPLAHPCDDYEDFRFGILKHVSAIEPHESLINDINLFEKYRIKNLSNFSEIKNGGYGNVYSALRKTGNELKPVAVKTIKIGRSIPFSMFLNEIDIMCIFRGTNNILQIIDFGMRTRDEFVIITELASGDGVDLLKKENPDKSQSLKILKDAIDALEVVHQAKVVHRDLKLENFLYFKNETTGKIKIKLADFGLSVMDTNVEGYCGSREHIAPEIELQREDSCFIDGKPSDIFSLSVLMKKFLGYAFPLFPEMENSSPGKRPKIKEVKELLLEYLEFLKIGEAGKIKRLSDVKNDLTLPEKITVIYDLIEQLNLLHEAKYFYGRLEWQNIFYVYEGPKKGFTRLANFRWNQWKPQSDDVVTLKSMISSLLDQDIFSDTSCTTIEDVWDALNSHVERTV